MNFPAFTNILVLVVSFSNYNANYKVIERIDLPAFGNILVLVVASSYSNSNKKVIVFF